MIFWLGLLAGVCAALCLLRSACAIVLVEHLSMRPALEDGDRVLVWRAWPRRWLRKGQLVVLHPPHEQGEGLAIKRLVGLPGETFQGYAQELDEATGERRRSWREWAIPEDACFVCGDNARNSVDSRHWGPLPLRSIWGVGLLRLRSRGRSGLERALALAALIGPPVGEAAPDWSAAALDGARVSASDWAGAPYALLVVTPREPAELVLAAYRAAAPRLLEAGFTILLVCCGAPDDASLLAEQLGLDLPLLSAGPRLVQDYRLPGFPYLCLVDAAGRVQGHGYATAHENVLLGGFRHAYVPGF